MPIKVFDHLLRREYCQLAVSYLGIAIPVSDEYAQVDRALIPVGDGKTQVEAYILVRDQDNRKEDNKCISWDALLQVQIVVHYQANAGGKYHGEMIAQEFLNAWEASDMVLSPDFKVYVCDVSSMRSITSETETTRTFTKNIIFTHKIEQIS